MGLIVPCIDSGDTTFNLQMSDSSITHDNNLGFTFVPRFWVILAGVQDPGIYNRHYFFSGSPFGPK